MRAPFQAGEFPAPVKYGYCNVGVVEQGPAELAGRNVFCLYPHQTRYVVPAGALHALPDGVPPARAVLAANSRPPSTRCGTRRRASAIASPSSAPAPSAASWRWLAARIAGAEVELVDVDERKGAAARALGVPFRAPAAARRDADVVVHASGSAAGLATALELAALRGDRHRRRAGTATQRRPCRSAARSTAGA